MKLKCVTTIYFSPTESTKKVVSLMANTLPIPTRDLDITCFSARNASRNFDSDELAIVGIPVYGGRVPDAAVQTLRNLRGSETPVILMATYGNREFEDALLELKDLLEENGFVAVSAAAVITEHSIMHSVARGRPDEEDKRLIRAFAKTSWKRLTAAENLGELAPLSVPGNRPYREYNGASLKPKAKKSCIKCGICSTGCPTAAIPLSNPTETNAALCISCMRCIRVCPNQSRALNPVLLAAAEKVFAAKFSARKEPNFFPENLPLA